ncbi:MAG TPA: ATP-dependent Clp protease proteolytic subunit [Bacillota bacterium]|nr:ATP-dependent Clp protease proteolytic subunit [Bacillota bacterium]
MIGTFTLRQSCAAVSAHLLALATTFPSEQLRKEGLLRSLFWMGHSKAITPEQAQARLLGYIATEPQSAQVNDELARVLAGGGVKPRLQNDTLVVNLSGELLGVPDMLVAMAGSAKAFRFNINSCLGGSLPAVDAMLKLVGSKPCSAHVAAFAGSASAMLVALTPGRRSMAPGASMLFHAPAVAAFGSSAELRRQADELDRLSDETAGRLSGRTGQPLAWCWSLLDGRDCIITAAEAKRRGLVDEIQ